jgi:hypothetical protein
MWSLVNQLAYTREHYNTTTERRKRVDLNVKAVSHLRQPLSLMPHEKWLFGVNEWITIQFGRMLRELTLAVGLFVTLSFPALQMIISIHRIMNTND